MIPADNPIALIFPRAFDSEELVTTLIDVEQFFSKWPSLPELFVPFLPPKNHYARKQNLQLLNNAGLGFGAAIKEAVKKTRADFCFVLDLPLEFPLADVFHSWLEFESQSHLDIVIGSRRLPESSRLREPPRWFWKFDNWINDRLGQKMGLPMKDLTTSFYGFRVQKLRRLVDEVSDPSFCFAPRLIQKARTARLGISEMPMHWNPSMKEIWSRAPLDQWHLLKLSFFT